MDLYKEGVFNNWTFQSTKGILTLQQLCALPLTMLDIIAVELNTEFKQSKKKSFLDKTPDNLSKKKLDLVLDIMQTKQEVNKQAQNTKVIETNNKKIDELIAKKQEKVLEDLSIEELQALKR